MTLATAVLAQGISAQGDVSVQGVQRDKQKSFFLDRSQVQTGLKSNGQEVSHDAHRADLC